MAKPFANSIRNSLPNILVIILMLWLGFLKYCLEVKLEKPICINCIISSWSSSKHQRHLHLQNRGTNRANNQHTHTQQNLNWANTQHKCVPALFNVWRKTLVHSTYISRRLRKWTFMAFLRRDWTERWKLYFEGFYKQEAQIEGHTVKMEHKLMVTGF